MRILLLSDTHIGITTEGQLKNCFRAAAKETFDVIVHAGDYGGGAVGHKSVRKTVEMMRKFFPTQPILSTIGNHDYWCDNRKTTKRVSAAGGFKWVPMRPGPEDFEENLTNIREIFKNANIHFLDKDGVYSHPEFPQIVFIGVSGWYNTCPPPTNDGNFMPIGIDGDTHRSILRQTEKDLFDHVDSGLKDFDGSWQNLVFVSHFPVIEAGNDYKGAFDKYSWARHIGDYFIREYNCRYFINGHAHQLHKGPLRYECGSDYYNPKHLIVEVI